MVLGSPEFIEDLQTVLEGNAREQAGLNSLTNHPHWREVIQVLEELKGEKWQSFVNRHKDWGRDLALYLGRKRGGLKLKELGDLAGRIDYATVSNSIKRFERLMQADEKLARLVKKADHQLMSRTM